MNTVTVPLLVISREGVEKKKKLGESRSRSKKCKRYVKTRIKVNTAIAKMRKRDKHNLDVSSMMRSHGICNLGKGQLNWCL